MTMFVVAFVCTVISFTMSCTCSSGQCCVELPSLSKPTSKMKTFSSIQPPHHFPRSRFFSSTATRYSLFFLLCNCNWITIFLYFKKLWNKYNWCAHHYNHVKLSLTNVIWNHAWMNECLFSIHTLQDSLHWFIPSFMFILFPFTYFNFQKANKEN